MKGSGKQKGRKGIKKKIFAYCMVAYPLLHYIVFTVYVNIATVLESVKNWNPATGNIDFVGILNYKTIFSRLQYDVALQRSVRNTLLWIPLGVLIMVPVGIVIAYILSRRIKFHKFYQTVFFFPCVMPIVVTTMAFSFMLHPTIGVLNRFLGAVGLENLQFAWLGDQRTALPTVFFFCVWAGFGMYTIMAAGAISRIPGEIYDVGKLDGIGPLREFISVVIPMIWPTVTTLVVLAASSAFAVFIQPQLLTNGGPNNATRTVALYLVEEVKNGNYGRASALGVISAIAGFVVVSIIRKLLDLRESVEM